MNTRVAAAAGLIGGAAGIVILKVSGVDMPTVPPGLVLLVVAALALALTRWRWAPVPCVVAALAEIVGFFASGSAGHLADGSVGVVAGTWIRLAGILTAVIAGMLATATAAQTRQSA